MPQICGVCKKNLKHFKFWKYFYWKHDKATLNSTGLFINKGKWAFLIVHC